MEEELKKIGDDRYEDGFNDGVFETVINLYLKGRITIDEVAEEMKMTQEAFLSKYEMHKAKQ